MSKLRLTHVYPDQMLTGGLDLYHITTPNSIVPTADSDSTEYDEKQDYFTQTHVWETIIETIRLRANVVIVGQLDEDGFSFAVEHKDALDVDQMQTMLQDLGEQAFSNDGQTTVDLSGVTLVEVEDFRIDLDFGQGALIITPDSVTLEEGETQQFSAEFESGTEPTETVWTVDDTNIATISASGLLTAVAEGSTTVSVDGYDTTVTVTVTAPPAP